MRNVCVLLILFFITSCTEEQFSPVISNADDQTAINNNLIAYPKRKTAQQTRGLSVDNDWGNWKKVKLASGDSVAVPWGDLVSTTIPVDICQDIKSANGWDLIVHTVNGYGEVGMNYLIFHNKYTGILKVFYYLEPSHSSLQNTAIWKLHFETPQSYLAFSEDIANDATKKNIEDIYLGNITNNISKGYSIGWNCFQTELAYDPDFTRGTLQIIPEAMTTSTIKLEGTIDTKTEGLIISTTNSNIANGAVKSTANFVGQQAENWTKKAIGKSAFSGINLVVKGAGSIVKSGINLLLGSFTGGFNKEEQTTQSVQLRTNGTVTLAGELQTVQSGMISPLRFSISKEDVGRLGAWCLNDVPTLLITPDAYFVEPDPAGIWVNNYATSPFRPEYNPVINPDLLPYIKNYSFDCKLYEKYSVNQRNAFGKINKTSYTHHLERRFLRYDDVYDPYSMIIVPVWAKDENGNVIDIDLYNPPYRVYIPDDDAMGIAGAHGDFDFTSHYILVVSLTIQIEQEGNESTIVSNHTFIPKLAWDELPYEHRFDAYPYCPIEYK